MHDGERPNYVKQAPISWMTVRNSLLEWEDINTHQFLETFDVTRFKSKFCSASDKQDNPFGNSSDLQSGDLEWQRKLVLNEKMQPSGFSVAQKM